MPITTYPMQDNNVTLPTEEPVVKVNGDIIWINTRVLADMSNNRWAALSFADGKFYLDGKELQQ
jgi:hypothetical protein